jgi:hypothetical protein
LIQLPPLPPTRIDKPAPGPAQADPIYAVIERHIQIRAVWSAQTEFEGISDHEKKLIAAANEEYTEATETLVQTSPTTIEGLRRLMDYMLSEQERLGDTFFDDDEQVMAFVASVGQSVRGLAVQS